MIRARGVKKKQGGSQKKGGRGDTRRSWNVRDAGGRRGIGEVVDRWGEEDDGRSDRYRERKAERTGRKGGKGCSSKKENRKKKKKRWQDFIKKKIKRKNKKE